MSHDHSHHSANRTRLAIAFAITATILVAEVIGAVITGSLALLVDAGHMVVDAGGLLTALVAASLMLRPATERRTWGFRRAEVIAAAAQAAVLLVVGLYAVYEGIRRLFEPVEVQSTGLLIFGIVGLVGNVVAMLVLSGGRGSSLNMRAAFLEVVTDALGSVAVIISAIVIATTGWVGIDAVVGLLIAALIIPRALKLLRESGGVLLEETPPNLDLADVRTHILEVPHVVDVHDLHASRISTDLPVLTAHVVLEDQCFHDGHATEILHDLQQCVATHFPVSVKHSTFQLEPVGMVDVEDACAPSHDHH
ncbi:cation diffusion facilitator family transporter [Gulosibacter molinativorax]|uniref:Cation transporter n=1 Tax=Gulosibacter molinativorax TaxID=256821 RepID=A0ABT7C5W2_9MICO|nr:cation diffusion facilitator family transporter [Gulosibacter molinativorax]MDJ1370154.1 cation transporter [Gulosibacter molinativorax]QUY61565.1 Cobalt-zinc-cadmium resistance protein czcD [Gulosibacter molinativorax]